MAKVEKNIQYNLLIIRIWGVVLCRDTITLLLWEFHQRRFFNEGDIPYDFGANEGRMPIDLLGSGNDMFSFPFLLKI